MALPKANRLRQRRQFNAVYEHGIRRHERHFTLRGLRKRRPAGESASIEAIPTCIGISISQKVSKKATVRNRIKRQIRAALRQLLPRIKSGWWLVVIVRPLAIECDYEQILRELEQLLAAAEVMNGNEGRNHL